jgi:hypothetical protein
MSTQKEIALRINEVKLRLEHGPGNVDELVTEFSAKWEISPRTVERYVAYAKDTIRDELKMGDSILEEARNELITEEMRNSILSTIELDARLCAIIEGKLIAEKIVRNKDGNPTRISCLPSHRDIIYAIDKLYRRRGSYRKPGEKDLATPIFNIVVHNEEEANVLYKIKNQP